MEAMSMSNEQLATRFVEILSERATRNGLTVPRWSTLPANWRRIWIETVPAFLEELGYQAIAGGRFDERDEDEQIRVFCEGLTARQRLKTYRQLYAIGCRIDGIARAIDRLSSPRK
jgi:hypothetical protein